MAQRRKQPEPGGKPKRSSGSSPRGAAPAGRAAPTKRTKAARSIRSAGAKGRPGTRAAREAAAREAASQLAEAHGGERAAGRRQGPADPFSTGLRRHDVLPMLILHYISDTPSYGNQLMERISAVTAGAVSVNPNTMYPLLRELEGRGLVEGRWEHPERRSRRYYSITRSGRAEYRRLLKEVRPFLDSLARSIEEIVGEVYG